jgi:hypothetical protein
VNYFRTQNFEKQKEGRSLRINPLEVEIARYEIPETKYSSGTSDKYPITEYSRHSKAYQEVEKYFSQSIADEALQYIETIEQNPEYHRVTGAVKRIQDFFKGLPTKNYLEPELGIGSSDSLISYTGTDMKKLHAIGLDSIYNKEKLKFELFQKENQNFCLSLNGYYFYFASLSESIRFIGSEIELIILQKETDSTLTVYSIFEELYSSMKELHSSLDQFKIKNGKLRCMFHFNRIHSLIPSYHLELDPKSLELTVICSEK